ncbi:hypothetical protein BDW72DRAFT_198874 [Aspergillus terricola var. indicus]
MAAKAEGEKDTAPVWSPEGDVSNGEDDLYSTGVRLLCVVLALVLVIFLVSLDLTIIATTIPRATDDSIAFQTSPACKNALLLLMGDPMPRPTQLNPNLH